MKASMVPWEAASKQAKSVMIWPPAKTSIRNRPPLISSTTFASSRAAPWRLSSTGGQAVDVRHWTCGCAMTLGASTIAAAATAASAPPVFTRNLRRSVVTLPSSCPDELMVGALGDVVPGTHQRLELREGRVDLPGHGSLLGFLPGDLGRQLLEIAQHRHRKLEHLDLALELRLESSECDRVLRVVVREAIDLHGGGGVIEGPLQIDGKRFVRLLVEAELGRVAGLVPARVVIVPRGLVETELHVVMRPDPFGGVDHAPLQLGVDLGGRGEDRRAARLDIDLAALARADAHLEPLVVADRVRLLPEPSGHLRRDRRGGTGDEVEGRVRLLPELEAVALVVPGGHAFGVHAERDGREPLDRPRGPVVCGSHECLDGALRSGGEAVERWHDLAARVDLDPEPPAARLLDHLRQPLGRALEMVERRSPGRRHPPLDLRLSDDVGGVDDGCSDD